NRKFLCQPQIIPITNLIPISQIEPEADNSLDQVSNSSDLSIQSNRENTEASISSTFQNDIDEYLSQEEFEYLKTLGLIENDAVLDTNDMCLKYALGAYFASNEGITKNLQ
ncbi:12169_t:CDS:2, partial [Racocetra fulgida]